MFFPRVLHLINPILNLNPVHLLQHRLGGEPKEDPCRGGMNAVNRETDHITGDDLRPVDLMRPDENRRRVHNGSVNGEG